MRRRLRVTGHRVLLLLLLAERVCHNRLVAIAGILPPDEEIERVCQERGVRRLRLFGSAASGHFDPVTSDLDFIVEFLPGRASRIDDYLGLQGDLARLTGRSIDLVTKESLRNPYFTASALATAKDIYTS